MILTKVAIRSARLIPAPIKRVVHSQRLVDGVLRKFYANMLGDGEIAIETGPMKGIRLVLGEHASHAHLRGEYELPTIQAVDRLTPAGCICYDLGASIGYFSLLMARKARHVYAFEPAPHAAVEIRKHARANKFSNITIVPVPVSKDERQVRFAVTDVTYGSSINETETRWPVLHLRTTTLDSFAADNPAPDFIKIDVEGEEGNVLEGARGVLSTRDQQMCCEIHSIDAAQAVARIMRECRYRLYDLNGGAFEVPATVAPGEFHVLGIPD